MLLEILKKIIEPYFTNNRKSAMFVLKIFLLVAINFLQQNKVTSGGKWSCKSLVCKTSDAIGSSTHISSVLIPQNFRNVVC